MQKCQSLGLQTPDSIPRKRPDKAAHAAHKKTVDERCVKMKHNSICKSPDLAQALSNSVRCQTQMAIEASRLYNLHVLSSLTSGQPVEIDSSSYFRTALCLVSTVQQKGRGLGPSFLGLQTVFDESYKEHRCADFKPPSRDGQAQMTTYLSQQMYTNARTMVSCHLLKRLRKLVALEVVRMTLKPGYRFVSRFEAKHVNKIVTGIMDSLIKNEEYTMPTSSPLAVEIERIQSWVQSLKNRFPLLFPIVKVKKRWTEYIPLLHHISGIFETHIVQRQQTKLGCKKGIKLFSLLPIASLTAKHVRIDTTVLQELAKHAGLDAREEGIWDRYWSASKTVQGHKGQSVRKFGRMLDTNGVAVSIHFEKPKNDSDAVEDEDAEASVLTSDQAESQYAKETSRLDKQVQKAVIPDDITRCIAIDPGGNTMAYGVMEGDCKANKQSIECGTAEYRHIALMDRMQQHRKQLLTSSGLEAEVCNIPTPRGSTVASMSEHLAYLLPRLESFLKHYGTQRQMNMKFTAYSRKQMAMQTMVNRIAPKDEQVLLAYGAADFPHAMKGNVASAYQRLKKHLIRQPNVTLVNVGECNTSQNCCCCHIRMKNAVKEVVDGEEVVKEPIHAVKVCPHCLTTWNRDLNAARNIAFLFRTLRSGGQRPERFRLQSKQSRGRGLTAASGGGCPHRGPLRIQQ